MLCITKYGAPLSAILPSPSTTFLTISTFIYRLLLFDRKTTIIPKNEKPVLHFEAVRANRDRYRHWGTHFYDFCLLERNRLTETNDHYIAAKRPFELAVLRNVIPPTEWETLDDVIASKISERDKGKPWIWLEKIK